MPTLIKVSYQDLKEEVQYLVKHQGRYFVDRPLTFEGNTWFTAAPFREAVLVRDADEIYQIVDAKI